MKIVIIGGDAAGLSAGAQIKRLSPETEVTVLERKNYISYSNCSIPYILSGKIASMQDIIHLTPEVYTATRGPEVIIAAEVIKINSSQKIVLFKKGGNVEKIHYDRLIIASGASYA
ncbi:FAD-dependent oxidoreductase, partial [Candidatus Calescamantes bacterium]|nr:FAD-dependent oxidoreductase [Candidatus Calescamantes bacterium]